jgi:protease I
MGKLDGKRIAMVATDGVERVELEEPRAAFEQEGAQVILLSLQAGDFDGFDHLDKVTTFTAEGAVGDADPADFDGLALPGGVANGDFVRADPGAVAFVKAVFEAGKPVAAICHAPWVLAEADVVRGRRMTSFPSLQTDLRNAGAEWVDEEVVVDGNLVTSRNPDDLPAFNARAVESFAAVAAS